MDERSTLQFRSNLFPTSTKGQLVNDRKFLASISDPEALAILWRYNGSRGAHLNRLQQRQLEAAVHCSYADDGDFPWGTPVGSDRVVCLCEKTDCPRFGECTDPQSGSGHPKTPRDGVSVTAAEVQKSPSRQRKATSPRAAGPGKAGGAKTGSIFARGWSEDEKRRLREAYPKCKRETLYRMFPHRSSSDVDLQIDLMGLASLPQPRRTKPKQSSARGTRGNQSDASRKPLSQQPAKKKRGKVTKSPKPWTVSEDILIRSNYPRFGSDITRWSKQLYGRKKGDIEKRAKWLGLTYGPDGRRS